MYYLLTLSYNHNCIKFKSETRRVLSFITLNSYKISLNAILVFQLMMKVENHDIFDSC